MNSPVRGTVDVDDDYCTRDDDDRTIPSESEVKQIEEKLFEAVSKIKINLFMFNSPVFVKREHRPTEEVERLMDNLSLNPNPERKGNNADSLYPEKAKIRRDEFVLYRRQSRTEGDQIDYFAKISDEVVLSIFSWLPKSSLAKCSSVCKRWRDLSYDCTLWKRYDFGRKLIKPYILGKILSRGVSVLRLAMADIKSPISSDIFHQETRCYSNLQYLDISLATIGVEALADLLSLCVHLRKLSLENCELNEDCLLSIAQNSYLMVLNMSMCTGLTPAGMHAISTHCTQLKEWNLAWTDLTAQCMESFLPFMPKGIERLNLSGHRDTLNDNGLIVICNRCPNLLELDISDCPLISELAFEVMVRQCSKLRELHSSRSYHIPADCNRRLKNLSDFKELDIFGTLTDKSLNALQKLMPEVSFNQNMFSTIARPTTGIRRTSIWGLRVRD
ncbi:s-phase kinase-associated protein 2 [Caerostris extrusa]|uniref:S-phase kinase-associated protein 2 n=1 Tax=Caerostris extrusa TaxID=172846 RepID=A0AAV4VQC7_CAEEX|nr:s-phase kinase-associated protein 2 [Caerostris extrusa]